MSQSDSPGAADGIRKVLAAKADALVRRSADDLAALLDDGFIYVNARGKVFDKASYIASYCTSGTIVFLSQAARDFTVSDFGSFAVTALLVDDVFASGGQTVAATCRSLCVFRAVEGRWLWVAGQTMPTVQDPAPPETRNHA
jgi:adenine/guanine phosphoribosyltransferase-like PRPP-binding protein